MAKVPVFKRILVVTKQDIAACCPLIAAYIKTPEAAKTVTELIIDLPDRHHDVDRSIIEYTRSLGHNNDTTTAMLQALEARKKSPYPTTGQKGSRPTKHPRLDSAKTHPDYNATIATLLLSLLPNLTTLRFFNVIHLICRSSKRFSFTPSTARMRDITTVSEMCSGSNILTDSPSTGTLLLEGLEDYQADDYEAFPKGMSGITKVHIGHCDVLGRVVSSILRLSTFLEELEYSTFGLMNVDGWCWTVSRVSLGKWLYEWRGELRRLDPDASVSKEFDGNVEAEGEGEGGEGGGWESVREYPSWSVGRLNEFESLTHLSIRIGLLLGYKDTFPKQKNLRLWANYRLVDAVPPKIESLRLYGCEKGQYAIADAHGAPGTWDPELKEEEEEEVWKRSTKNLS
ncbi:hypothetical protein B0T14DRAFT_565371 [Immersiella caudata]|uniref:Uncharacterized protein n=1 Tax=Immersiella caudata TaxID=314043 RepID=A0AA39WYN9_9PEZI|nr:hypothetical protein B0T14DRAFT_565371 [Immersiella caudata]